MSEEIFSRPPEDRAARAPGACCAPRHPRGIGSWSRETLYQNHVKVPIPSRDLLEAMETLTWFWYHNNKWPRKEPGPRSFKNLPILISVVLEYTNIIMAAGGVAYYSYTSRHECSLRHERP